MPAIDRRRFITIAAAVAGAGVLGRPALAAAPEPIVWHGQSMGAQTTLILNHPDAEKAQALLHRVEAELRRLERIFTLYRADSELSRLNRAGVLAAPSPEMIEALRLAGRVHAATGGRFDPTVQPLWRAYAAGGEVAALAQARGLVGFDRVRVGEGRIVMDAGQELTLNGIAQGYITDRITDLLRAAGAERTLVDMGEIRALGGRSATEGWRVGLAGGGEVELVDRALAVTEAAGFTFDPEGRLPHLIDPASGTARSDWQRIAVLAPQAGLADALSTGLSLAPAAAIRTTLAGFPGVEVRALDARGVETAFG